MQRLVILAFVCTVAFTPVAERLQSPLAVPSAATCPRTPLVLPPPQCLSVPPGADGNNGGEQQQKDANSNTIAINKLSDYVVPGWTGPHECAGRFCLYANEGGLAEGSGQGGIVVITTEEGLERIKRIEARIKKAATAAAAKRGNGRDAGKGTGQRAAEDDQKANANPPFRVAPIEGKGLGLVATRPLKRGDELMTVYPALLAHRTFIDAVPRRDQHRVLAAAVRRMAPDATREAFLAQVGQGGWWDGLGDEEENFGAKVWDIVWTNSFQMDVGSTAGGNRAHSRFEDDDGDDKKAQQRRDKEGHHYGNFPAVSRLNHDCRPNIAFRMDSLLTHHTTVARDVAVGEELTISYLDPFASHEKRRQRTKASWGFECTCSVCSASPREVAASDARLKELATIYEALEGFKTDPPGIVTIKKIDRMLALYKQERLDAFAAGGYTLAALNLNMFARRARAVEWATRAAEATAIEHGPDAPDVEAMRELAEHPEDHFTWRARLRAP